MLGWKMLELWNKFSKRERKLGNKLRLKIVRIKRKYKRRKIGLIVNLEVKIKSKGQGSTVEEVRLRNII